MKKVNKFFIPGIVGLLGSVSLFAGNKSKPNILILFSDDQRADALGCAGNKYIKTPNIDQLAANGVMFQNNYVNGGLQAAISAPSRAMLLTGKSLFNVREDLKDMTTMPEYFGQHGYVTFGTGKWHNGAESLERSFQSGKNFMVRGMSNHFKVPCQDLGADGKLGEVEIKGFSTEIFGNSAIEFLDDYSKGDKKDPFMCYVAFTAPHDPRTPDLDFIGTYKDDELPLPGNFMKYHPFAFDNMRVRDENLAAWPRTPEIVQASLADYYGLITHMDKKIGEIIETLKKNGLFENTIIVFAADNGLAVGSHGLLGKQNLYEHSMKVPLIFSGKGIPKNKKMDGFTYLFDIYPTLCNMAKLPEPENANGKSLIKIINGKQKSVRDVMFTAYRTTVRAVRDTEWKLIRYPERDYSQLFNLKNDPLELVNLAYKTEYKDKLQTMTELLKKCQIEANDTLPLTAKKILPLEYNPASFKQVADRDQNEYILKKYYKGVDVSNKSSHE